MAQASKKQASAQTKNVSAKAPIDAEEILDDEALDADPDVVAADSLDDDKLDTGLGGDGDEEDLLEGIPEEELKATVDPSCEHQKSPSRRYSAS